MKSYREIADSVFARRDEYVIQQRKKKQTITRATASVGSVALVSLAGFALFKNDAFREAPPLSDGAPTTTTNAIPTQTGSTTTAATGAQTTAPTITAPTTAPSKTEATKTTAPSTTEPPATTTSETKSTITTTAPTKLLITADEADTTGNFDEMTLSKNGKYITPLLQQTMECYKGVDVVYAVIVGIPPMMQDWDEDFWNDTEELLRWREEYRNAYDAFYEEAKQLNPSWDDGNTNHIKVWTDTMRAKYEYVRQLINERDRLKEQYQGPYVESVLNRRFDALKRLCDAEPVDVACHYQGHFDIYHHEYYVELTAESINALAQQGGYTFRLSLPDQRDYGDWDIDE